MGRWTHFEGDAARLPEGMKRIAYDADTRVYTFQDRDGTLYRGPPDEEYGNLKPIPKTTTITRRGAFADSDVALERKAMQVDASAQAMSFEDFLPSHVMTKATSPVDGRPSHLPSLSSTSVESNGGKRQPRALFKEAVRRTALPKMQGVVHNLRRSMTSVRRGPQTGDGESTRLLRGAASVDLSRNSSVATSRTAVSDRGSAVR